MATKPVILWFRRDLRLHDNPALNHAAETGRPVLPVYILDEHFERPMGAASRWWLDKSLRALDAALQDRGSRIILRQGNALAQLQALIGETDADTVFMNSLFEPEAFEHDAEIAHTLKADGVECRGFNGALLCRPGAVLNGSGQPYKVFTPFLRALLATAEAPAHTTGRRQIQTPKTVQSDDLDSWKLHPHRPDWSKGFDWTPGEDGASQALSRFIPSGLKTYAKDRDFPDRQGANSRLSPHLHWGEISPWRVIDRARQAAKDGKVSESEADKFIAEIGWREFSAHLLHHFPYIAER